MRKLYDFEYYTINSKGDWSLYLVRNTGVAGRHILLHDLKRSGYKYDRKQKAYFQTIQEFGEIEPLRFAVIITLHKYNG